MSCGLCICGNFLAPKSRHRRALGLQRIVEMLGEKRCTICIKPVFMMDFAGFNHGIYAEAKKNETSHIHLGNQTVVKPLLLLRQFTDKTN